MQLIESRGSGDRDNCTLSNFAPSTKQRMQRRGPARRRRLTTGRRGGNLSEPDHVSRSLERIRGWMPGPTTAQLGHEPLSLERDHRGAGCDQSVLEGGRSVPEPWASETQPCSWNLACST